MPLTLRRALPSDASAVMQFMREPEVYAGLLQQPYPTEELWRQRLLESSAPGKSDINLVAELDGKVVGMAGLHPAGLALRRRHVMSLGISVASAAQGQGVGRALMDALLDYADNWGQVLRIELGVYADNARAIRLYERCGFQHEGRMRAYALRDGQYVDSLAMARLHPRPPTWA